MPALPGHSSGTPRGLGGRDGGSGCSNRTFRLWISFSRLRMRENWLEHVANVPGPCLRLFFSKALVSKSNRSNFPEHRRAPTQGAPISLCTVTLTEGILRFNCHFLLVHYQLHFFLSFFPLPPVIEVENEVPLPASRVGRSRLP